MTSIEADYRNRQERRLHYAAREAPAMHRRARPALPAQARAEGHSIRHEVHQVSLAVAEQSAAQTWLTGAFA